MGTLTVRISDEVERSLRKRAAQLYGARKGALSRAIEDAIRTWISTTSTEGREVEVVYRTFKGDELIAEASSLEDLAKKLKRRGESVRGLRILREPAPAQERHLGLKIRRANS